MPADVGFERIWRFRISDGARDRFESVYGSDGAWAALFSRHAGFRGTELRRVTDAPGEYLVIDRWTSRAAWTAFRHEHAAAYEELDRRCEALTSFEELVEEIVTTVPASDADAIAAVRNAHLHLVALVVHDYDPAIRFFVDVLGFDLVEDSPSLTNDGRPKRWVVVRPPGAQTGLLLARADGDQQSAIVGNQHGGRVGFFLHVDDFDAYYDRMIAAGVEFVRPPRTEPYGRVAVFLDIAGNRWDLVGPVA